jgi:hypothetical protein
MVCAERYDVVIFTARTALGPVRPWLTEHGMSGFENELLAASAEPSVK